MQREQMALSQRQHAESLALQREQMDRPVAAIQKNVSLATSQMVNDQQTAKNNLRGIRSTYSQFLDNEDTGGGKEKLG